MGCRKTSLHDLPTLLIHDEKDIAKKWIKEIKDELQNLLEPRIEIDVRSIFDIQQPRRSSYKNVVLFFTEEAELKDKHIHDWLEATGFQGQCDKYLVIYGTSANHFSLDRKPNVIKSSAFENVSAWWETLLLFLYSRNRKGCGKPQSMHLEIFAADSEHVNYTKQQVSDFCNRYGITQDDDESPTMKVMLLDNQNNEWLTDEKKNELLERRIRRKKTAAIVMRGFEIVPQLSPFVPDQVVRFQKLHLTLVLLVGFGILEGKLNSDDVRSPDIGLQYAVRRSGHKELSVNWTTFTHGRNEKREQAVLKIDVIQDKEWTRANIVDLNMETDSCNISHPGKPLLRLTIATETGIRTEFRKSSIPLRKRFRRFRQQVRKCLRWCTKQVRKCTRRCTNQVRTCQRGCTKHVRTCLSGCSKQARTCRRGCTKHVRTCLSGCSKQARTCQRECTKRVRTCLSSCLKQTRACERGCMKQIRKCLRWCSNQARTCQRGCTTHLQDCLKCCTDNKKYFRKLLVLCIFNPFVIVYLLNPVTWLLLWYSGKTDREPFIVGSGVIIVAQMLAFSVFMIYLIIQAVIDSDLLVLLAIIIVAMIGGLGLFAGYGIITIQLLIEILEKDA